MHVILGHQSAFSGGIQIAKIVARKAWRRPRLWRIGRKSRRAQKCADCFAIGDGGDKAHGSTTFGTNKDIKFKSALHELSPTVIFWLMLF